MNKYIRDCERGFWDYDRHGRKSCTAKILLAPNFTQSNINAKPRSVRFGTVRPDFGVASQVSFAVGLLPQSCVGSLLPIHAQHIAYMDIWFVAYTCEYNAWVLFQQSMQVFQYEKHVFKTHVSYDKSHNEQAATGKGRGFFSSMNQVATQQVYDERNILSV